MTTATIVSVAFVKISSMIDMCLHQNVAQDGEGSR